MKSFLALGCAVFLLSSCSSPEQNESNHGVLPAVETQYSERPDAQNPAAGNRAWPGGWKYRLDADSPDYVVTADTLIKNPDVYFTSMTPGWHVTMRRPRGIFWHPASTASGDYSVSSSIYLFDPGSRNEAYGLILGGSNLDAENQEYLYFLIRRSGEFLVKLRRGNGTSTVVGWTKNKAVAQWTDESLQMIQNTLGIRVESDLISFSVNDTEVHSMEKGDLPTAGIVGFRFNHGVNVHVSSLNVELSGALE